jgi:hypothetical protein
MRLTIEPDLVTSNVEVRGRHAISLSDYLLWDSELLLWRKFHLHLGFAAARRVTYYYQISPVRCDQLTANHCLTAF